MNKKVIIGCILILITVVLVIVYGFYHTKKSSPESTVVFEKGDLKIEVYYNRPFKKGRQIFGKLVPFGKTWRTGANEATTFSTNKALIIGDKNLPAGKYSLWTVPNQNSWSVVLNSEIPMWGLSLTTGEATRDSDFDLLDIEMPVTTLSSVVEQLTISVDQIDSENLELVFLWDSTKVVVPITVSGQ